jgi:hypothetical protein
MISTQNLSPLPDIASLKKLTQSLALLDAIICPEWEYRYYSFDAHWSSDLSVFFMRNGSGDEFITLFAKEGAIIKGFAHESMMSPYRHDPLRLWSGILDQVPKSLRRYLDDPAFELIATTFCVWKTITDTEWKCGKIAFPDDDFGDGSAMLLSILDGIPTTYQKYAQEYFDKTIELSVISHIYQHMSLTHEVVNKLNSNLQMSDVSEELKSIDYST